MKISNFILVILFLFISLSSFGQTRRTILSLVPSGNIMSSDSDAQYSGNIGLGLRSMVSIAETNFYWGADTVLGISFLRGETINNWLEKHPLSRGLFYVSMQAPIGYSWNDQIASSLNFFLGGGPTFKMKFDGVLFQFGTFVEGGFITAKTNKKIGFFFSGRFSMYSIVFSPLPLDNTSLKDHELSIFLGMKWEKIKPRRF